MPTSSLQSQIPNLVIGAHQSIAGGLDKAFERAERIGCRALQHFTKSTNQWRAKPLTGEDIASYKTAASNSTITTVIAHDSYLVNLAASDATVLQDSRDGLLAEFQRCAALGIRFLVLHPGSHTGAGLMGGIGRIVESLNWIHDRLGTADVMSVLETTAGQGTAIGYRFEHLRNIIDSVDQPRRMAVCIDTCHIFAAGYDISTKAGYEKTMQEFDDIVGLDRLVALHVNDSKKPLGSRVDRHEHIGKGAIGPLAFSLMLRDERLVNVPKILETPKGDDLKEDKMNLATLRRLAPCQI